MKISLLGTGLMGFPLAQRLMDLQHSVIVFNRTISKTDDLKEKGAIVAKSPQEALKEGECILLMLSDAKVIEDVLFAKKSVNLSEKVIIQMGTIAPGESQLIGKKVEDCGGQYLECPVLGSRKEARNGNLILMVGSTKNQFETWKDFLQGLGNNVRYVGEIGKAAALKLALNQLIASYAISYSLSLGIVEKNKVDVDLFADILRESSLYSPMFDKKLNGWKKREFENPNFPLKHMFKDVHLVCQEAKDKGLSTVVLETISSEIAKGIDQGLEDKDYSSVFNVINGF